MIPRWKLKRELVSIRDHLVGLPQTIASLPARLSEPQRRRAHDAAFPNNMHLTKGRIELGKRLAVVVLFQPRGIAPSTIETCQGLVAGGYTPLVISNAVLSAKDQALLAETCWRVVERPNFGYDFGNKLTATVDVEYAGENHVIDTGFIVFNEATYPNFLKLLDNIGIK